MYPCDSADQYSRLGCPPHRFCVPLSHIPISNLSSFAAASQPPPSHVCSCTLGTDLFEDDDYTTLHSCHRSNDATALASLWLLLAFISFVPTIYFLAIVIKSWRSHRLGATETAESSAKSSKWNSFFMCQSNQQSDKSSTKPLASSSTDLLPYTQATIPPKKHIGLRLTSILGIISMGLLTIFSLQRARLVSNINDSNYKPVYVRKSLPPFFRF